MYPACMKRGGLSSLDQNFWAVIGPIAPVVPPPLVMWCQCNLTD